MHALQRLFYQNLLRQIARMTQCRVTREFLTPNGGWSGLLRLSAPLNMRKITEKRSKTKN
jgi:hypothetical protein